MPPFPNDQVALPALAFCIPTPVSLNRHIVTACLCRLDHTSTPSTGTRDPKKESERKAPPEKHLPQFYVSPSKKDLLLDQADYISRKYAVFISRNFTPILYLTCIFFTALLGLFQFSSEKSVVSLKILPVASDAARTRKKISRSVSLAYFFLAAVAG